jgi:group I intron endonuclease
MRFNCKKFLTERELFTEDLYKSGVYKITFSNSTSGKVYIGSTEVPFIKRFGQHINDLRRKTKPKKKLQKAYNKYGEVNLIFEIVEICDKDFRIRETFYIEQFNSYKNGYNCTKEGNSCKGFKMYEDAVRKREIPLLQYDLDGNFIREWKSYAEIYRKVGGFASKDILKDSNHSANGYLWRVKRENYPLKIDPYVDLTKQEIYQYSLSGEFIQKWKSILDAANNLKIPVGNICHHLEGTHKMCYGYYFSKFPAEFPVYERKHPFQKKIKVTNLKTGEILSFEGKREMALKLKLNRSGIKHALENNNGLMIKKQLKIEEI